MNDDSRTKMLLIRIGDIAENSGMLGFGFMLYAGSQLFTDERFSFVHIANFVMASIFVTVTLEIFLQPEKQLLGARHS